MTDNTRLRSTVNIMDHTDPGPAKCKLSETGCNVYFTVTATPANVLPGKMPIPTIKRPCRGGVSALLQDNAISRLVLQASGRVREYAAWRCAAISCRLRVQPCGPR